MRRSIGSRWIGVATADATSICELSDRHLHYFRGPKGDRCYGGRWITPPELRADMADPATGHQADPARYYFRTNPLFETGAQAYAWLNDIVCVGAGYLVEGRIAYEVSQVV